MILFLVSLAPAILHALEMPIFDDLFDVSFPDETHGWACGRWGTVVHTSDGGKSWIRQNSGTDFTLTSIHFVDPQKGWAVGDKGTIIHTSDGGKTWERQESPRLVVEGGRKWIGGTITSEKKATPYIYFMGVHFVNARKGWIAAERTYILYTEDGGKTWQIQFKDEDFILKSVSFCETWQRMGKGLGNAHLFGITVKGKGHIVVAGKGVVRVSFDAGETFKVPRIEPAIKYGWIYGVAPRGNSGFVGVGSGGWIYLSDKNGNSWIRVSGR